MDHTRYPRGDPHLPFRVRTLARLYGLNRATVRKWKERDSVGDRQHRPHELRATLSPAQETVVLAIRETLELPLDDLLVVVREFICPELSRSALARMSPATCRSTSSTCP
jgi:hypothetical protein